MIVSVIYPKAEGAAFDHDYYRDHHMKLVVDRWGPLGLRSAHIMRGAGTPQGDAPAFELIALLEFDSAEAFGRAASTHGAEVMGDVKNFTTITPKVQFNERVG